jgi:hypothetical protein
MKTKSDTKRLPWVSLSLVTLWRALAVREDEELDARDAASTLFRLFRSKHVSDLKLIFHVAFLVLSICALFGAGLAICYFITVLGWAHLVDIHAESKGTTTIAFLSSIATFSGGIMAWVYLTASKRLGVVDLFACEIATLCRVGTIFNAGQQRVATFKRIDERKTIDPQTRSIQRSPRSATPGNYVSQEDYFPIFDANSQDLETLEALVVGHITEFYTYMKSSRDSQRKLAQSQTLEDAKEAAANIVYMLARGRQSAISLNSSLLEPRT